ncbi:MAG: sigma-70 family RNA polymerase sigma factor [Cytophagaceae bacterium]|nr:sigma-70 family RNA polymerase sigma factor [Cytophagaceae bacterium]
MRLLKSKDTQAFAYLYDQYGAAIYGIALRILKEEGPAEEVLQDAFLRCWDRFDEYNPNKGRLFTWMLNITRNLAIDVLRSKSFSKQAHTEGIEDAEIHWKEESQTRTEYIGVKDALQQLPEEQRLLVDLMYFQGYSQSEISEQFQIPLGTVKTRVRAAMLKLKEIFA